MGGGEINRSQLWVRVDLGGLRQRLGLRLVKEVHFGI